MQSEQNIVASFDRKGEYIYTGNSKGKVSGEFVLVLVTVQKKNYRLVQSDALKVTCIVLPLSGVGD